jgi:hypothetical protein
MFIIEMTQQLMKYIYGDNNINSHSLNLCVLYLLSEKQIVDIQ